jgi:hypothetical protein
MKAAFIGIPQLARKSGLHLSSTHSNSIFPIFPAPIRRHDGDEKKLLELISPRSEYDPAIVGKPALASRRLALNRLES